MTSETKRANEQAAYQLGWMAYERGDEECNIAADETMVDMFGGYMPTEGTVTMAYQRGFEDAMVAAIQE